MANDTALRISDSGRGETTLALLHGYLESLEVWEDLAKRLAPYYRIVAIDIPGHGISQVRGEVHTMDFVPTRCRPCSKSSASVAAFWRDTRWAAMPQRLLPNVIPTCFRD